MPINKILPSRRAKAAVAAMVVAAVTSGWAALFGGAAPDTAAEIRAAIAQGHTPPAVQLAIDKLIKPWEGVHTVAYKDIVGVWTICWGETKGVRPGMRKTLAECDDMLKRRVVADYYLPLVDGLRGFATAPVSLQSSMTSLAYNVGSAGARSSSAARHLTAGRYKQACEAATAWNKAGGLVVRGLVNRREMGDAKRIGEAELCVSGLSPEARK